MYGWGYSAAYPFMFPLYMWPLAMLSLTFLFLEKFMLGMCWDSLGTDFQCMWKTCMCSRVVTVSFSDPYMYLLEKVFDEVVSTIVY